MPGDVPADKFVWRDSDVQTAAAPADDLHGQCLVLSEVVSEAVAMATEIRNGSQSMDGTAQHAVDGIVKALHQADALLTVLGSTLGFSRGDGDPVQSDPGSTVVPGSSPTGAVQRALASRRPPAGPA